LFDLFGIIIALV